VTLLGSRVEGERGAGWELAHLLLRVDLDRPYVVDVGFGEGSLRPVPLEHVADGVMRHQNGLNVVFTSSPRRLEEFQGMSDFLQTSPESGFVRTRVCTVALPDGRLRLLKGGSFRRREPNGACAPPGVSYAPLDMSGFRVCRGAD